MDANKIASVEVMKDGISKGCYEITGILKTGEIVIALLSDTEKECLDLIIKLDTSNEEKLEKVKYLMSTRGRPAEELLQVYKQNVCGKKERSLKNGLRLK
jgi:hypothetical protein